MNLEGGPFGYKSKANQPASDKESTEEGAVQNGATGEANVKRKFFLSGRAKNALKAVVVAGSLAGGGYATYEGQKTVNADNEKLNHVFTIQDLSLQDKIRMLIGTSPYSNKYFERFSKEFPSFASFLRKDSRAGLIHLYKGEMKSLEETKKNIENIRKTRTEPILISADIEGGFIGHIGITTQDLIDHNVPPELLELRKKESEAYIEKHKGSVKVEQQAKMLTLPSQEWIGRQYKHIIDTIATTKNDAEKKQAVAKKQAFLKMMEGYGETIADICQEVGINVIFGPNLDMVKDVDGNTPDEKQDRSFGSNPAIVSDLATSYLRGFGRNGNVLPVVKHFIHSFIKTDDHEDPEASSITDKNDGSIQVFANVINASSPEERIKYLEKINKTLKEKRELKQAIKKSPKGKLRGKRSLPTKGEKITIEKIRQAQGEPGYPLGIMTSVASSNAYEWKGKGAPSIPGAYSLRQVGKIYNPKEANQGLGHRGIIVSDDLSMASSDGYIKNLREKSGTKFSAEALAIHQALRAGNTIALVKQVAGNEEEIAEEVAALIREKVSFKATRQVLSPLSYENGRKGADLTEEMVDDFVKKVLELKVSMGLLDKEVIDGKEYYILDPRIYNPRTVDVLMNSFFSNQLPWTKKEYPAETEQPNFAKLLYKAFKNFTLSFYRINFPTIEDSYKDAEKNKKKLILVDKSVERMFIYDLESRKKEKEYVVGIGKGGLTPRRYVGDHSTPTGTYELVGKRDDEWWEKNKGVHFPPAYGGKDGGMLVLAGQWHPEIAIHGSDQGTLGQVSNGCVRVNNKDVKTLMKEVPIGSMIIITK